MARIKAIKQKITGFVGVYLSYYLDGTTGGVIVTLQTLLFLLAFLFSPKYGLISQKLTALQQEWLASK
jgi:ABC-type Mn2+/Zn2+ transport system permease subunit